MELAISTTFDFDLSFQEKASMIRNAGFTVISLSGGDYERSGYLTTPGRAQLRDVCLKEGIAIDSIHAPLGASIDISHTDRDIRQYSVQIMKQAIHSCSEFGSSLLIMHLCNRFSEHDLCSRIVNARHSLEELVPYAREKKIRIAAENLISPVSNNLFRTLIKENKDMTVGVCFDTSHAHVAKELTSFLPEFGSRIIAVHVSDNKGMLDDHMLPYEGSIDWEHLMKCFSDIPYTGVFMLEVEMRESMFKDPVVFLEQAYARGQKLVRIMSRGEHEPSVV